MVKIEGYIADIYGNHFINTEIRVYYVSSANTRTYTSTTTNDEGYFAVFVTHPGYGYKTDDFGLSIKNMGTWTSPTNYGQIPIGNCITYYLDIENVIGYTYDEEVALDLYEYDTTSRYTITNSGIYLFDNRYYYKKNTYVTVFYRYENRMRFWYVTPENYNTVNLNETGGTVMSSYAYVNVVRDINGQYMDATIWPWAYLYEGNKLCEFGKFECNTVGQYGTNAIFYWKVPIRCYNDNNYSATPTITIGGYGIKDKTVNILLSYQTEQFIRVTTTVDYTYRIPTAVEMSYLLGGKVTDYESLHSKLALANREIDTWFGNTSVKFPDTNDYPEKIPIPYYVTRSFEPTHGAVFDVDSYSGSIGGSDNAIRCLVGDKITTSTDMAMPSGRSSYMVKSPMHNASEFPIDADINNVMVGSVECSDAVTKLVMDHLKKDVYYMPQTMSNQMLIVNQLYTKYIKEVYMDYDKAINNINRRNSSTALKKIVVLGNISDSRMSSLSKNPYTVGTDIYILNNYTGEVTNTSLKHFLRFTEEYNRAEYAPEEWKHFLVNGTRYFNTRFSAPSAGYYEFEVASFRKYIDNYFFPFTTLLSSMYVSDYYKALYKRLSIYNEMRFDGKTFLGNNPIETLNGVYYYDITNSEQHSYYGCDNVRDKLAESGWTPYYIQADFEGTYSGNTGATMYLHEDLPIGDDEIWYKLYDGTCGNYYSTVLSAGSDYIGGGVCPDKKNKQGYWVVKLKDDYYQYLGNDGGHYTLFNSDKNPAFAEKLSEIVVPRNVITIYDETFKGCRRLSKIIFPKRTVSSVLSLLITGNNIFSGCTNLLEIDFPDNTLINRQGFENSNIIKLNLYNAFTSKVSGKTLSGFHDMKNLVDVIFPQDLVKLEDFSFSGCTSLTEIDLSYTTIREIGSYTFKDCTSLQTVRLPYNTLVSLGGSSFRCCTSLTEIDLSYTKIKEIKDNTFSGCTSLQTVKLPPTLQTIDGDTFEGCTSLTEIDLSNAKIEEIDSTAFDGCTSLAKIDLSYTIIQEIDYATFRDCTSLRTVKLPTTLQTIVGSSFRDCTSLTEIDLSYTIIQEIGYATFSGCTSLQTVKLPYNTLVSLGESSFRCCTSLTEIDLSYTTIQEIGSFTFKDCTSLRTVKLPPTLQTIDGDTFRDCTSLTEIDLSNTIIQEIGYYAFSGCTSLRTVRLSTTLQTIKFDSFYGCNNITIYVSSSVTGFPWGATNATRVNI